MNGSMILYILGHVLKIEGLLMLPSCLVAAYYGESQGWCYLAVAAVCMSVGLLMSRKKPADTLFFLKEGCIVTALSWTLMSAFGALPFVLTGEIPSFTNAMFETVSGFTTTGASILTDVEALCRCSLFWRSFTHWIGGMGVLVFLLAVVPLSGGSNFNLMRAESTGASVGKLVPKAGSTARILYLIYFGLTVVTFVLLLLGGMTPFDAITHAFGTAGTGGFGIKADSVASYSPYLQWVITVFMILFGVNFNAYYFILYRKFRKALGMDEVRWYFIIIAVSVAVIFWQIRDLYTTGFESLTHAAFQVGSIITTTGFATTDFNLWPTTSRLLLVCLMFVGGCAGSTGGGIKVSRFLLMARSVRREINSYIHPKSVRRIKMDGGVVDDDMIRSVGVYFLTFILVFAASVFLISLDGFDLVTTFTAVAATLNNIGPGLELVGPTGSFVAFSDMSKWVMIVDMLAGRLELFPMLVLFHPTAWRELYQRRRARKSKNL